jgi:hypothetical protein
MTENSQTRDAPVTSASLSNCQSLLVSLRQLKLLDRSQISESLTVFLSSGHTYFRAWRSIVALCLSEDTDGVDGRQLCSDAIDSAIDIVTKYELHELKLAGKGVWLLYTLLKFAPSDLAIQKATTDRVVDLAVDIVLKHQQAADSCMLLLKLLITLLTPPVGLQLVCNMSNEEVINSLPRTIATSNYISLMHVVMKELQAHFDPETAVAVMNFFAFVTPKVESNHNNNYFMSKFAPLLRLALSSLTNFDSTNGSFNLETLAVTNCELYVNTLVFLRTTAALHTENVSHGTMLICLT